MFTRLQNFNVNTHKRRVFSLSTFHCKNEIFPHPRDFLILLVWLTPPGYFTYEYRGSLCWRAVENGRISIGMIIKITKVLQKSCSQVGQSSSVTTRGAEIISICHFLSCFLWNFINVQCVNLKKLTCSRHIRYSMRYQFYSFAGL